MTDYDFEGKRVFLAGPMDSEPGWNRAAFDDAESKVRDAGGIEVWNPAILAPARGYRFLPSGWRARRISELVRNGFEGGKPDAEWITPHYDVIVLLPNWEQSEGVEVEKSVAETIGMDIVEIGADGEWRVCR